MKFNLKNRPFKEVFGKLEWDKRLDDYAKTLCMYDTFKLWFEGLEKELREKLDGISEQSKWFAAWTALIEEILGEEKNEV